MSNMFHVRCPNPHFQIDSTQAREKELSSPHIGILINESAAFDSVMKAYQTALVLYSKGST